MHQVPNPQNCGFERFRTYLLRARWSGLAQCLTRDAPAYNWIECNGADDDDNVDSKVIMQNDDVAVTVHCVPPSKVNSRRFPVPVLLGADCGRVRRCGDVAWATLVVCVCVLIRLDRCRRAISKEMVNSTWLWTAVLDYFFSNCKWPPSDIDRWLCLKHFSIWEYCDTKLTSCCFKFITMLS